MQEPQDQEFNPARSVASPNVPPWNSLTAFLVWVGSVLLILLVPGLFLAPYLLTKGSGMSRPEIADLAVKDPTAVLIQIGAILPVHLITLAICWFVVSNNRKFPFFSTLGWTSGGMRWWHYIGILLGFFVLASIVGYLLPEQENNLLRVLKSSRMAIYLVAFLAVVTAPLVEEVVYRGVMYSAFQRSAGRPAAILLVTALFALVHVPQYYPSYSTIILLMFLSLILTLIRAGTGNLLPCIILHTAFNALQSLLLLFNPELAPTAPSPLEKAATLLFFPK